MYVLCTQFTDIVKTNIQSKCILLVPNKEQHDLRMVLQMQNYLSSAQSPTVIRNDSFSLKINLTNVLSGFNVKSSFILVFITDYPNL